MTPSSHGIAWDEIRSKLPVWEQTGSGPRTDDEVILRNRAQAYRVRQTSEQHEESGMEIMCFTVAGAIAGIAWQDVAEVMPLRSIMRLPYSASALLGVCQLRGVLYPVLDISAMLSSGKTDEPHRHIIILEHSGIHAGLAVHEILGLRSTRGKRISVDVHGRSTLRGIVAFLTEDRIPVLDAHRLQEELQRAFPSRREGDSHPERQGALP